MEEMGRGRVEVLLGGRGLGARSGRGYGGKGRVNVMVGWGLGGVWC